MSEEYTKLIEWYYDAFSDEKKCVCVSEFIANELLEVFSRNHRATGLLFLRAGLVVFLDILYSIDHTTEYFYHLILFDTLRGIIKFVLLLNKHHAKLTKHTNVYVIMIFGGVY